MSKLEINKTEFSQKDIERKRLTKEVSRRMAEGLGKRARHLNEQEQERVSHEVERLMREEEARERKDVERIYNSLKGVSAPIEGCKILQAEFRIFIDRALNLEYSTAPQSPPPLTG